ncbi:MAG TPA: Gfo/Idh/MocA family oxidoreductase [Armatimonadetes bacterium]|jgi:UDP-N-acetylglucosamine 3-dehydrogenase|nr:Gfo/Idh/MocA family oxidoreductase [Armatimonadota bacterium]
MAGTPLKIGIIGAGAIGQRRHIPEAKANPDCTLVAVCDANAARVKEVAAKNDVKGYTDYKQMLEAEKLDAVVVCGPNTLHAQQTLDALKAGCHVLCEKPMATTREEARAMIDAAAKAGKNLMIGHNQRLMPPHVCAKEILESGKLGKVISFRTAFAHPGPEFWSVDNHAGTWFFKKGIASLGVTGDLGVHKADLMRWLLGDEFSEVSAVITTLNKRYPDGTLIDIDDNAVLTLRTRGGVLGTLMVSWTNYGAEDNWTVLYCEKGVLSIGTDPVWNVVVSYRNGDVEQHKVGEISTNTKQVSSGVLDQFVAEIQAGKKPAIDGEEGYRALDVILTAMEAAAANKTMKIA